jgi:hypothetical protein
LLFQTNPCQQDFACRWKRNILFPTPQRIVAITRTLIEKNAMAGPTMRSNHGISSGLRLQHCRTTK